MTQFSAGEEQKEGERDRDTVIHFHTLQSSQGKTHLLILPETLSVLSLVSFFLNILGVAVGPADIPQKSLTLSYSFLVSVFLTLWLPLWLSSPFGSSQTHWHTHIHTYTLTSAQWQPLPDRLTGVSPPRHSPGSGGPDRPVPCTLVSCPSFSPEPWHTLKSPTGSGGPLITVDA